MNDAEIVAAPQLVADLLEIRQAALQAVDPAQAVRRFMRHDPGSAQLRFGEIVWRLDEIQRILLVAAGKAAVPMAQAAAQILGPALHAGIVVTKYGHSSGYELPAALQVVEAGHPVPDANGRAGAQAILELLQSASPRDRVLVLLSGGASALLPLPVEGIPLEDLQQLTGLLLRSGATITELNIVRKHLDQLKGGQLAQAAAPARLVSLVLSDVVGDPLDIIASGPTVPDPSTFSDTWNVLKKYNLLDALPPPLRQHLAAGLAAHVPETPKPGDPLFAQVHNFIIGSNRQAGEAAVTAALALGYRSLLLTTFLEGEAREVARVIAAHARGLHAQHTPFAPPACLVWGGETTVTVHGNGKGGRNQELALAAALALDGLPGTVLMAWATDGSDGPTDAAGAIVDGATIRRARQLGCDPQAALANNDAYPLLETAGALMRTGPTGTNVNDLIVLLVRD